MTGALWSSGFRPFFLLGAVYGPLVLLAWLPVWFGWAPAEAAIPPLALWHGHELIYGFASAFICGFVLTALPSWAGTPEVRGAPLALLVVIWLIARAAAWSWQWLPIGLIATLDLLPFAALAAFVLPGLVRAIDLRYLGLLPILLGFIAADILFHLDIARGEFGLAERALHGALNVLVVLFAITAGRLTPAFTEAALEERGRPTPVVRSKPLEIAAVASVILFAIADWTGVPAMANAAVAIVTAVILGLRMCGWRTRLILSIPLILAMHVAYGWLATAIALRGLSDAFGIAPRAAWIHAFTVGALGMMMLALLNRVALRHTGRVASASPVTIAALAIMLAAGVMRVLASFAGEAHWMAASAVAWGLPFALFLIEHGAKLWRPSLPYDIRSAGRQVLESRR